MKHGKKQASSKQETGVHIHHAKQDEIRLNKYISDSGFCSRREADRLIDSGKVVVDGVVAALGVKIKDGQHVLVNGKEISKAKTLTYIALNKPVGIISTTDPNIKDNLTTFMNYHEMIFPIGRLDRDSEGLLLLTNDGDIVNKILREEFGHDKEYLVRVDKKVNATFLRLMSCGVEIYNPVADKYQVTNNCKVVQVDSHSFKITLNQGLNRQIRRMTKALGYKVVQLCRLRVMNVHLGDLPAGQWRYLTKEELIGINKAIK